MHRPSVLKPDPSALLRILEELEDSPPRKLRWNEAATLSPPQVPRSDLRAIELTHTESETTSSDKKVARPASGPLSANLLETVSRPVRPTHQDEDSYRPTAPRSRVP